MLLFLIRRTAQATIALALLVVTTFVIIRMAPGGPAYALLGPDFYTPERAAVIEATLGLDRPVAVQLWIWLQTLLTGEFGYSYIHKQAALDVVLERMPATLLVGAVAFVLMTVGGVLLGVWSSLRPDSLPGRVVTGGAVALLATPSFWLGMVLIFVFSAWLGLLPSAGMFTIGAPESLGDRLRHLLLPAVTLAAGHLATMALYTRAAMLDVLRQDYIRTARSKGLPARMVVLRHALRNAAIPVLTLSGLNLAHLVEGSVVVETLFAWPGVGQLTISSVGRRDYPVLLAIVLVTGAGVFAANLLADLATRLSDPRVTYD